MNGFYFFNFSFAFRSRWNANQASTHLFIFHREYIYILNFKISQFFDRSLYMTSSNSDSSYCDIGGTENRNIFNESELFPKSKRRGCIWLKNINWTTKCYVKPSCISGCKTLTFRCPFSDKTRLSSWARHVEFIKYIPVYVLTIVQTRMHCSRWN